MQQSIFKYFLSTKERIEFGSNLAFRLSRPQQIPDTQNDVTQYLFSWITHPTTSEWCAVIDTNAKIPVHQFIRDSIANDNGVSSFFDQFYLTAEEAQAKKNTVVNSFDSEGGLVLNINILDILPSDWTETTYSNLENDGWFNTDS